MRRSQSRFNERHPIMQREFITFSGLTRIREYVRDAKVTPGQTVRALCLLYDKRSTLSVAVLTAIVGYGYLTGYGDQA